jgi:hypothetical protein
VTGSLNKPEINEIAEWELHVEAMLESHEIKSFVFCQQGELFCTVLSYVFDLTPVFIIW